MAGDQIEIQIPKTQVTEKSAFTATAYFRTRETGAAATPTTVHYRVDNLTTLDNMVNWTSVTPGTSASIAIPASANVLQQAVRSRIGGSPYESLQLTVAIDRGLTTEVNRAVKWRVNDVHGVN